MSAETIEETGVQEEQEPETQTEETSEQTTEGGESQTQTQPEESEDVEDPRDLVIANQQTLIDTLTSQRQQGGERTETPEDDIRAKIAELGFGRIPTPTEDGKVVSTDWSPALEKLLALAEERALARFKKLAGPEIQEIRRTLASGRYESALAKNGVTDPAGKFAAFETREYERDANLARLRASGQVDLAAEIVAGRFARRQDTKRIAKGNELRERRLSGASLTDGAPRGSNGAAPKLKLSMSDRAFGRKLDEFVAGGGDPKNVVYVK